MPRCNAAPTPAVISLKEESQAAVAARDEGRGADDAAVDEGAQNLGRTAPNNKMIQVLGPAPAPFSLLRGRYRRRLLMKAKREVNVQAAVRDWLARARWPKKVRVQVDVDPYNFF